VKRGLAGLAVVVCAVLFQAPAHAAESIQPGDVLYSDDASCTLGFVVQGMGQTYFLTAAHCVKPAAQVTLDDGTVLGRAVAEGSTLDTPTDPADDWALIEVRAELVPLVSGAVRGHPGTPSGVALSGETSFGDLIAHSGWGIPFFVTDVTREQRYGVLVDQDQGTWASVGPDTYGDSGGPVIHVDTGKALGLVAQVCLGTCTSIGPTVEGILSRAALAGYNLTLRTA
jgi:trypsin